jgi:hypothetical protein
VINEAGSRPDIAGWWCLAVYQRAMQKLRADAISTGPSESCAKCFIPGFPATPLLMPGNPCGPGAVFTGAAGHVAIGNGRVADNNVKSLLT